MNPELILLLHKREDLKHRREYLFNRLVTDGSLVGDMRRRYEEVVVRSGDELERINARITELTQPPPPP